MIPPCVASECPNIYPTHFGRAFHEFVQKRLDTLIPKRTQLKSIVARKNKRIRRFCFRAHKTQTWREQTHFYETRKFMQNASAIAENKSMNLHEKKMLSVYVCTERNLCRTEPVNRFSYMFSFFYFSSSSLLHLHLCKFVFAVYLFLHSKFSFELELISFIFRSRWAWTSVSQLFLI